MIRYLLIILTHWINGGDVDNIPSLPSIQMDDIRNDITGQDYLHPNPNFTVWEIYTYYPDVYRNYTDIYVLDEEEVEL